MIAEVKDSTKTVRLIPFNFSTSQTYVLEVGEGYTRMVTGGQQLTYGTTPPATWLTATAYVVGDIKRNSGSDYYCREAHTSGTFATDLAASKWYLLEDSGGSGAIIEVPNSYTESELPTIKFTQSADVLTMVQPNVAPSQLSRYSATKWTFVAQALNTGPFQGINTDTAVSIWASANVGTVTLSASQDLFYAKHVGMLIYIEQKDFGVSWLPGATKAIGDVVRSGANYYMALTAGTTGQNIPIGTGDHWNDGGVDWRYLHNGYGVARITAVTNAKLATADVISRLPDGTTSAGYAASIVVGTNSAYTDGTISAVVTAHGLTLGSYGVCLATVQATQILSGFSNTTERTVEYRVSDANTILFDIPRNSGIFQNTVQSFKPPLSSQVSASYKWAFGAFGDPSVGDATNGYGPGFPSAVTYYQQRLVFGGTSGAPDTIWTSKTGSYSDFGTSNPVLDSDAITFTLAGNQVNAVKSMTQMDKLLVLTDGGVWATGSGGQSEAITPSNIGVKLQGYQGVSDLPPLGIGGAALYVQNKGQVVRDLNYQWANDAYTGQNLTAKGSHLINGHQITDWAFQQSPLNVVWMVRGDGVLLGLTYLREQEVAAWHRHDTDGLYEAVCVVSEGDEDVLYAVVKRTINGAIKRFIERFDTRVLGDIRDAFFVDCGITMDNRNTTATTMALSGGTAYDSTELITITASAAAFVYPGTTDVGDQIVYTDDDGVAYRVTIESTTSTTVAQGRPVNVIPSGFRSATTEWAWARGTVPVAHLEGETVSVLADGFVVSPQPVVTGGVVTLTTPAVRAQVGLPYDCDAETLAIAPQTAETVRGNYKLVTVLRAILQETRSIKAGPDASKLYEAKTRDVASGYTVPPALISDIVEIRLNATWDRNGTTFIRHSDPTPIGLLALMPEVSIGGS